MTSPLFEPPALCGPLRRPHQMLAEQRYGGHKSICTRVFDGETRALVAEMILNHAVMKASYAAYDREAPELGRGR